jgi:hypothetical protein
MIAALALLLVLTGAAGEPTGTLTLACQGTTRLSIAGSPWSPDEPSSMSLIVNFATLTVKASDTVTSVMTTNSPSE